MSGVALSMPRAWALLLLMVGIEALATLMLKQSAGMRVLAPGLAALAGYGVVLWLFSYVLRALPASLAYAVWTGLGTLLVVMAGWLWYGEALSMARIVGISLIVLGVVLINQRKASHDV